MIVNKYNNGGGGSMSGGSADYAVSAGTSNSTKLLEGETNFPQNANTGDVVAIGEQSTKKGGTRALLPSTGIYQFDGSSWNKIEASSGSSVSAYYLSPSETFPANPVEGQIANYSDGRDNIGVLYRYDGEDWVPYGGGDNTILKSVEEEPSDLDNGDAFAQYIVETATTNNVNILEINPADFSGDWGAYVDEYGGEFGIFCYNGEVSFTTRRYSDPLILHPASDFTEDFYQLLPDDGFDPSDENISMAQFWVKNDLVDGLVYFAFPDRYSIDTSNLPYGITDNGNDDIETGALTEGVFQKGEKYVSEEVNCVSVSFPNGYESGDIWISGDVSIEVMEWPSEATIVTNAEFLGSRYYFEVGDGDNQIITVYDDNQEKVVFLADGDTDSFTMDGMGTTATCNCSFSDGVFSAVVIKNAVGWENTIFDLSETRVEKQDYNYKLARMEDLPKPKHLVPDAQPNYGYILRYDDKPHWVYPTEITPVLLLNIPTDGQADDYPTFLMRSGYQDFAWKKLEQNKLEAVAELPVEAESGSVYSLANASGCGIYQAEGSHPENGWVNYEGKAFPQGSVTKIRVPYDDDGESNICRFKTDPNGSGEMSIYWHPENTSDRHWDGLPDGTSQNDGEFTATDPWGNTMTGVKVGDYIEVTFSAPLYNGDGDIYTYRNTEAYSVIAVAEYANAVMSTDVSRMVKITQSDYDDLVLNNTVDPNTLYLIINPQV